MALKTGMLVGIVGTGDIGVLIQIRASSNTCVIKLNNGSLKKNVPLDDVEEARDMSDTKEKKSPIRLGATGSPNKTPTKLAALSVDTRRSSDKLKTTSSVLEVGDAVRARCNGGSRWFPGKILRVHRDGTYDVEYSDGDVEKKMSPSDVEAALSANSPLASPPRKPLGKGFDVGDKVKARYKGGVKLFSGKIAKVRADGTYDITYDDGDVETRVAEGMIEAASPRNDSEEDRPTRTKPAGFRVDESVKARYKGGKKLFPGKIKRVNSDGTYDVRYDDGDEEKRVKAENIEAVETDRAREPVTKTSSRTKQLAVGKKVKARYKRGKKLYPGKISRVRSDGTYDIDYDDGEVETRVEAELIEATDDEDELFADSGDDTKAKPARRPSWEIGDRVKAYYGKGKKLFPGRIAKVHSNGTYDIRYDDGDSETRVDPSFIEGEGSTQEKEKGTRSQSTAKSSTTQALRVGDAVKARYKGGAKFFPGKITRERMDGTFDVRYDDGDSEERVKPDLIERIEAVDREAASKPSATKKAAFEVGDVVKAPFQKGKKLFRGKISRARSDGTYDVVFDDGDRDTHVPGELIEPEEPSTGRETKKTELKIGDVVKARYKKGKKLFPGKVSRVRSDGTYDIEYDDGDVELKVQADMIEAPEGSSLNDAGKDRSSTKSLSVGDRVRARYNKGSKLFSGEITAVNRDGTYDVRYDDGDKEKSVDEKNIELEEDRKEPSPQKPSSKLKLGDAVQASNKNGVKMFPGKISRVHSDGTYDVKFNDGDSERRVPPSRIKEDTKDEGSQRKKPGWSVGDAVKAKYKNGSKFFPGKIARVRSDGTYDIVYEDGDEESRVDSTRILALTVEAAKGGPDSPRSPQKTSAFEVGDVVKARYKKGSKLFPGKISRVRSDGTYDIKYDDGDVETNVSSAFIEGQEKASPKAREAEERKPGLAVGDKVNARYKGGLKRFPGKITKARLDGTFDIEYDDGDIELRVSSSAIEAVAKPKATTDKSEAKSSTKKDDLVDSDSDGKAKGKSKAIRVGDVVDADFKRKGKFHRGKITRVRSDGTFDIEYDVGASEERVRSSDIKVVDGKQESSDDTERKPKRKPSKSPRASSDSDDKPSKEKPKRKARASSGSSESDGSRPATLKKGARVTYRKGEDSKSRRVGIIRRVHSDGSYDVEYSDGDKSKRVAPKLLIQCSDSEDSDSSRGKEERDGNKSGPSFRRHERVLASWRRSSRLSKPRTTSNWAKATVLEKNSDGTYTIRYSDGVVEEDAPPEALKKSIKKKRSHSGGDASGSDGSSGTARKKRSRSSALGTESLFLLEQLAMTLFEEGSLKEKPKLVLLRGDSDSSSSESSTSSAASGPGSSRQKKKTAVDKVLKRLFDASSLQTYRRLFKESDTKGSGTISRSKIIAIVESLLSASNVSTHTKQSREDGRVSSTLTEWFATHDDLRTHRHFEFKTLMLAFAYAKNRLGKARMEQSVATVLEGRFASYHESKRQLELWQQKLGFRLFETLQRHFHEHALPNMIPSRIRVSELSIIFEDVSRNAMPNKPLDVYLQQHQLFPHHTLVLPEFLCCYYQLYGSTSDLSSGVNPSQALELRPVAFVASCLFSNGDPVCQRHGDLVRRLSVGRTQAQLDLILRFREAFESLLNTDAAIADTQEEPLLPTSQLSAFAARVASDPTGLEPALTSLRKRSAAVSLVEVYASCGFLIDEVTSAPTIRNAIDRMRMRVELAEVRRVIVHVRSMCLKVLRFPNNADYWRVRADSAAFQQKLGRFDGATSLLEAVGFVEHRKAHYELRGARNMSGKRVAALKKTTLDSLREKCVELDRELSLFDGVESISSLLQRVSHAREREGNVFSLDECQTVLKYLSVYIENVLKNPKDSRCWRIRESNATFQRQIGYLPHSVELMESIGFDLVPSLHGNAFVLRGTGVSAAPVKKANEDSVTASLSNFSFTSVTSHTEWFLWRRKQEIESLLEDDMRYLHDIVGHRPTKAVGAHDPGNKTPVDATQLVSTATPDSMYPYGTNALEAFNATSIQRQQIEMMRCAFTTLDVDQKGFLLEADFYRCYGAPATLPLCCRFESFDVGKDSKVDFADFVAALGPLLDHSFEVTSGRDGEKRASFSTDDGESTLCEAASLLVGDLRLGCSAAEALAVLDNLVGLLSRIMQEPANQSLWVVSDAVDTRAVRFPASRKLLELCGFREASDGESVPSYELRPRNLRFKTSNTAELPSSLDAATVLRLGTIAAMLGGHYRGMKTSGISDVSAVSRAISASQRCSVAWMRAVQLATSCLGNILSQPENARYRELNTTTSTYMNLVGNTKGGLELLLFIGFRETASGSLVLSSSVSMEDIRARRLELDVGLALLRAKMTETEQAEGVGIEQRKSYRMPVTRIDRSNSFKSQPELSHRHHPRPKGINKADHQAHLTLRPATALSRRQGGNKLQKRPVTSQPRRDPIESEILAAIQPTEERLRLASRAQPLASKRRGANVSRNGSSLTERKQTRRRPAAPPSAGGHTMVLAASADAGSDTIVVQKGQFVLRGTCVRVGAEIRDLYEERIVVDVTADEHAPGLSRFRLGSPLRFFHPAKELVSTVPLQSAETARRLESCDAQTVLRGILHEIIYNAALQSERAARAAQLKLLEELEHDQVGTTLVTSFEHIATVPLTSSNLQVGPSMRYLTNWNTKATGNVVSITRDFPSDRKLRVFWDGLVLQSGSSNKRVRLKDVRETVRRNAHLSILLSTARQATDSHGKPSLLDTKNDDFQTSYDGFKAIFDLPSARLKPTDDEIGLQLPLMYLRKHFQLLMQATETMVDGYRCVQVSELLLSVYKDIQAHPPVVSDDSQDNLQGVEETLAVCRQLEDEFVGWISWPELVYFVRYGTRVLTPEVFPWNSQDLRLAGDHTERREIAEIVSGKHSLRIAVLFFDGSAEIWTFPTDGDAKLESRAPVLFSTKKSNVTSGAPLFQAWMDFNSVNDATSSPKNQLRQRSSARIHHFKRSAGASATLLQFCAWDSMLCVNSSILQEPGSGSLRFFCCSRHWLSPDRQVAVEHIKLSCSQGNERPSKASRTRETRAKREAPISSAGVLRTFDITANGSKVVYSNGAVAVLWVACTGTGRVLCSIKLLPSPSEKCRTLFQIAEGNKQIQVYATVLSKTFQRVGMWLLPHETTKVQALERERVFPFGGKMGSVVQLVVTSGYLFVASRDGAVVVWSTSQADGSPLYRLRIPLDGAELQSICCQTLGNKSYETRNCKVQVSTTAAELAQWEMDVLQPLETPLRFVVYVFDDGDVIRVAVPEQFDVRYVTLDDPAFEFRSFLQSTEWSKIRRVPLHKHRILRVAFVALKHLRDGVFTQKSVLEFFEDMDKRGVMWKAGEELNRFIASYQASVTVALRVFYREGDDETIELTKPQKDLQSQQPRDDNSVVLLGATLIAKDRREFQVWNLAMETVNDEDESAFESKQRRLSRARQALAQRSAYCVESDRLLRTRKDIANEKELAEQEHKWLAVVRKIDDGIRGVIAFDGRPDVAADNLANDVHEFALASLFAQPSSPVESFFRGLFETTAEIKAAHVSTMVGPKSVSITELLKTMQSEKQLNACFTLWMDPVEKEIQRVGRDTRELTWDQVSVLVRNTQASSVSPASLGALFIDLGLAEAFQNDGNELASTLSLASFADQLRGFLSTSSATSSLQSTMNRLLSPRTVVEFMMECTNVSSFLYAMISRLRGLVTKLTKAITDGVPEEVYAVQLQLHKWQAKLHHLARTQNDLYSGIVDCGIQDRTEVSVEDVQSLKRFLKTPLPHVSPNVSSITLKSRCDTIQCRDRVVVDAKGRVDGSGSSYVGLSVVYIFIGTDDSAEQTYQQELTFLGKVRHLRVRAYFLPAYLELTTAPMLATVNAPMACTGDSKDIHCVVTECLTGWTSLFECIKHMHSSVFSASHWIPMLSFWSVRVLMILLTMQNERFSLTCPVEMGALLVSPDGSDLRLGSLAGGRFVRFGEDGRDEETLDRCLTRAFGEFVFDLLSRCFCPELPSSEHTSSIEDLADSDDDRLRNMRRYLVQLLDHDSISNEGKKQKQAPLTDFSSIFQIVGEELETGGLQMLCRAALVALQPPPTCVGLQYIWTLCGRPQMTEVLGDPSEFQTVSRHMVHLVRFQRAFSSLQQHLVVCSEECDEEQLESGHRERVTEEWTATLERLFEFTSTGNFHDTSPGRIFDFMLNRILSDDIPGQLCGISMRVFTQCSTIGENEAARQSIQTLLKSFVTVLRLVETRASHGQIKGNALLQRLTLQVLAALHCLASGQLPRKHQSACIGSRFSRTVAASAVLWRLSEPFLRELLAIETSNSFPVLLQWLDARRASFSFAPPFPVSCVNVDEGDSKLTLARLEIALWWSGHSPLLPQHSSRHTVDSEAIEENTNAEQPVTARYLHCVHETLGTEFKITTGVGVPKFRLGALQQWFGPNYLERKSCYPMVFVRPMVATVWRELSFERFICTLLRDGDEKIVLGGLSLLECSTRIFRYDALRSPRAEAFSKSAVDSSSYLFSCPERSFAVHLCSQTITYEVKRVLETTTRALKVLGESGTSSASRSQHPLVAILCVAMAWLVNCLHGGDNATQFWECSGIDKLVVAHCKANSLPFVKAKDSNMINQVFRQGQRLAQDGGGKWRVFSSVGDVSSRSVTRHCSPFRLLLEEMIVTGSSRCISLMRSLVLSRTFRDEACLAESHTESVASTSDSAWQRDLLASGDYGKVSHAINLARDITDLNGTSNEQVQLIVHVKALFLNDTASAAVAHMIRFATVCGEIWGWLETAWRAVAMSASSPPREIASNSSRGQGDVVMAGLALLHTVISHSSLTLKEINKLTSLSVADDDSPASVLHELVAWIVELPHGTSRTPGSVFSVVMEASINVLVNAVRTRAYDDVALETLETCVDIRALLALLQLDCAVCTGDGRTIVSIHEKQQLWSVLLSFDSRAVTSAILATDFLDRAVFSRFSFSVGVASEDQLTRLNRRLEGVMLLEMLLHASSRREKSVNTHMLLGEVCKLALHHDSIAHEARYIRNAANAFDKHVTVAKRVLQLVCCLCIDFSSQSASRVFLEQLEGVGIPPWVVHFHQQLRASPTEEEVSGAEHLASRVDLFWRDWRGACGDEMKTNHRTSVQVTATESDKAVQSILANVSRRPRAKQANRAAPVQPYPDRSSKPVKLERPKVAVSPVKMDDPPNRLAASVLIAEETKKPKPSLVNTLVSIDADSALRLVKRSTTAIVQPSETMHTRETADSFDSDASSSFPADSSSDEERLKHRKHAPRRTKREPAEHKEDREEKEESKLETSSRSSSDDSAPPVPKRPQRRKPQRPAAEAAPAPSPRQQQLDALRATFRKYDVDGDGLISFIDLRRALDRQTKAQSHRLSDVEIQQWITAKDRSGRGAVCMADFVQAFATPDK